MDWLGVAALIAACVGGIGLGIWPRSRNSRVAFMVISVGSWWVALCLLAWRFVSVDLRLVEVSRYTQDELSWPLRLAGTWAGANGSVLLWFTLVVTAVAVLAPPRSTMARCGQRSWRGRGRSMGPTLRAGIRGPALWSRPESGARTLGDERPSTAALCRAGSCDGNRLAKLQRPNTAT